GLEAVAALVAAAGVGGRRLREAIQRLTDGPQHLDDLVRECALPRRTVEALLRAAQPDLHEASGGRVALAPHKLVEYRTRFAVPPVRLDDHGLTARMQDLHDSTPDERAEIDDAIA